MPFRASRQLAPVAAAALLLAACAPAPSPDAGLSAESKTSLAGRTLVGLSERPPAMQRRAYQGAAGYGGGGLIGALVSVAVVTAINVAEAASSSVDAMPAPSADLARHAERVLIARLAGDLGAKDGLAAASESAAQGEKAPAAEDAPTAAEDAPAAEDAAPEVVVNVVSNGHVLQSTGVATGETFIYAGAMSATVTDSATGRLYGKGVCSWRRDLPGREKFLLLAAGHLGVDTADAEAKIDDRDRARADAVSAEKGAPASGPVENAPMEGVLTPEQEVAYMDDLAKQDAESCAGELLNKLLN